MSHSSEDPVCSRCGANSSLIWQRDQKGAIICLNCHSMEKSVSKTPPNINIADPPTSGKQNSVPKSSLRVSQQSSSSSSASYSSAAEVSMSGVTTRRAARSHERAKAKQQQQLQQGSASVRSDSNGGHGDEVVPAGMDELQGKDKSKSVISEFLNNCLPQDCPGNKAELAAVQSPGTACRSPSPCSSTRSRHNLRQGYPVQAPKSQPYVITSSSIQHQVSEMNLGQTSNCYLLSCVGGGFVQGTVYETGDVVSLLDRDGGVYYAVMRGFLCDQYANKFTVLTWLLPIRPNPTHFDPTLFILGIHNELYLETDLIM